MILVTVVARYPTIRAGLSAAVAAGDDFQVEAEVSGIDDLASRLQSFLPDVLLIDLVDESPNSLELLREMSNAGELPGVVLLFGSETEALDGFALPGTSLLLRDATSEEIRAAVRAAVLGLRTLDPRIVDAVNEHLRVTSPSAPLDVSPGLLSPRELDVLDGIARGLPNKSIARELGISEHTVKFHIGSIFQKLDVSSRSEAIVAAARLGLLDLRL